MSKLTDIKQKILQLDGGSFQELCDAILYKLGYKNVLSLGLNSGTMKTTKGIPDTYFLDQNRKYIFVMYTTHQSNVFKKVYDDICECIKPEKTGVEVADIVEIIYCHTSANISAGKDKELREFCSSKGILLQLFGLDEISSRLYTVFHGISRDFLGIPISTDQIYDYEEFVSIHDSNGMSASLNTVFQFREVECIDVLEKVERASVTLITGPAGVGKTRLAIKCAQEYSNNKNFKMLCVQSNSLPIHEDLKIYLEKPDKYLLLIDDVNQISGLKHILHYLTKNKQGYDVKIVATVRDYARESVIKDFREFVLPEVCSINPFKDDEIKRFLEVNLNILNSIYLDKIVNIAEGNARLAMLAGKLALANQSLSSINDASQLYENYYGKFFENTVFNQERRLIMTAGIIAFLTAINLERMENLIPVLEKVGITKELFINCTYRLHELELVDIYSDKAVKISDQSLGNYLLSYVFVKKKVIPLAEMIKVCFENYKPRVINAINTLANIFASKELHHQLDKDISITWDDFEKSQSPLFYDYVKTFYFIRPVDTLLIIKKQIDAIQHQSFDVSIIDFNKKVRNNTVNDDILNILGGFKNREEIVEALDLFFDYFKKQPHRFMDFYHTINNSYSIKKDSHHYDYWTQILLIQKLIENSNVWKDENICNLFIKVAAEFLKLTFSPAESGRHQTIIMYNIPVQLSKGSKKYRKAIWNGLLTLYKNNSYQKEIEKIIKDYGHYNKEEIDLQIVQYDYQFISKFFNKLFLSEKLSHCIIAKMLVNQLNYLGIDTGNEISNFLNSSDLIIYEILKGERYFLNLNFEEGEELRNLEIKKLANNLNIETIIKIINICLEYEEYEPNDTWDIRQGLQYLMDYLENNKELFINSVKIYLEKNTPLSLEPDYIVNLLFKFVGIEETYQIINMFRFDEKNTWEYSLYKNLPQEAITKQYVQRFYDFLAKDDRHVNTSPLRNLEFLDKYKNIDDDVFIKTSNILLEKYDFSPFMFSIYFGAMFNEHITDRIILIERYNQDFKLLKEIYFKLISYDRNKDYNGKFLTQLIDYDISIIEDLVKFISSNENYPKINSEIFLGAIWDCKNYEEVANQFFHGLYNKGLAPWLLSKYLLSMLKCSKKNKRRIIYQDDWITKFISYNYDKKELMKIIFSAISELSLERRTNHILNFIKLNPDPQLFSEIQIEPNNWGGIGSMIPIMEERISFLENLLPSLTGITYLPHKKRIIDKINIWNSRIEQEQLDEFLESR